MKDSFLPLNIDKIGNMSGNIYKSVVIMGKRANQVTEEIKAELADKLSEFAPAYDNLEEVMENKEQIEISRHYERKPKSTQTAAEEFLKGKVFFRDPHEGVF
ncbi:MAG: DNA-directed RNA polymerase subunit omega [Bacteroidetes bacterium]|nr:MAG: DNA-directed RNA polymerase subunit omega [Bacteroidota bacterium]